MTRRGIDVAGTLAMAGALLCWSVVPLALKYLTSVLSDGFTTNAVRYPIAAVLYLPWFVAAARDRTNRRVLWLALLPAIPNVLGQTCWAWAPYYIDPGLTSFVVRLSVVWGIVASLILFRMERRLLRSTRFWCGGLLSLAGFFTIALASEAIHLRATKVGVLLAVACSVFWGLYGVSVKATIGRTSPLVMFALVATYTSIGCVALLPYGEPQRLWHMNAVQTMVLVGSAFVGIAAAHGFFYIALQRLGATIPSTITRWRRS